MAEVDASAEASGPEKIAEDSSSLYLRSFTHDQSYSLQTDTSQDDFTKTLRGPRSVFSLSLSLSVFLPVFAKLLAEFWKLGGRDLVTSLRQLMAVRDTVLLRGSVESALELWLLVAQEDKMAATDDPGHKVLCSFLLGQTQSAHCERIFALVVEMQYLAKQFKQKNFSAPPKFFGNPK